MLGHVVHKDALFTVGAHLQEAHVQERIHLVPARRTSLADLVPRLDARDTKYVVANRLANKLRLGKLREHTNRAASRSSRHLGKQETSFEEVQEEVQQVVVEVVVVVVGDDVYMQWSCRSYAARLEEWYGQFLSTTGQRS